MPDDLGFIPVPHGVAIPHQQHLTRQHVCTRYGYDDAGRVKTTTDSLGHVTRTFYDELNRVAGTVHNWQAGFTLDNCFDAGLDPKRDENVCTLYEYDDGPAGPLGKGNQTTVTDAKNNKSLTVYDGPACPQG